MINSLFRTSIHRKTKEKYQQKLSIEDSAIVTPDAALHKQQRDNRYCHISVEDVTPSRPTKKHTSKTVLVNLKDSHNRTEASNPSAVAPIQYQEEKQCARESPPSKCQSGKHPVVHPSTSSSVQDIATGSTINPSLLEEGRRPPVTVVESSGLVSAAHLCEQKAGNPSKRRRRRKERLTSPSRGDEDYSKQDGIELAEHPSEDICNWLQLPSGDRNDSTTDPEHLQTLKSCDTSHDDHVMVSGHYRSSTEQRLQNHSAQTESIAQRKTILQDSAPQLTVLQRGENRH